MAINERLIHTAADAADGAASAEQNLILHLDANDLDSYDGDGSVWYDISEHDVTIPLSDNADELKLHLNASDTTSYDPATDTTTWTDISGNDNDATLTSLTNTDHDIDNGGYFHLDGANDYMTVSSFTELNSGARSYEVWCNPDNLTSLDHLLGRYGSTASDRDFFIRQGSSGACEVGIYTSGGTVASNFTQSGMFTAGEWTHVVLTVEGDSSGDNVKLYKNGEQLGTTRTLAGARNGSTTIPLIIGDINGFIGQYVWDGKIGAVRIYSKELSASEVGQNYRHGRDYIYTDLVDDTDLELHLDAADLTDSSTTWNDKVVSGNNGTLGNATYEEELNDSVHIPATSFSSGNTIEFSSNPVLNENVYSVEGWVKFGDYSPFATSRYITLSDYGAASGHHAIGRRPATGFSTGVYEDYINRVSYKATDSLGATFNGRWHHFVSVRNGTSLNQYLNGNLVGTHTVTSGAPSNDTMTLGALKLSSSSENAYLGGDIGQVRIYQSALTADEVMQNYLFTKNDYPNTNHATGNNISSADWNSNGYFDLDGASEYFTVSHNQSLNITNSGWSASVWVNRDVTGEMMILSKRSSTSGSYGYFAEVTAAGNYYIASYNTSNSANVVQTASAGTAQWEHVVYTYDGTNLKIYLGGVYKAQTAYSGVPSTNTVDLLIGEYNLSSVKWNGKISDVKVFDRALTPEEVTAEHAKGYNGIG